MLGRRTKTKPAHKEELKKRRESALEDRKKIKEALQQENQTPLLSAQELKNSFDEWMKIAADNVRHTSKYAENQCKQQLELGID